MNGVALIGAALAIVVMVASAGFQVIARYIFDAPPIWTEETARYAMVWAGLLGASAAFRLKQDPTLFPDMVKRDGGRGFALALVRAAGVFIFVAPILYYSFFGRGMNIAKGFLARTLGREAEMLGVPMVFFTAAIPIAFAFIVIHVIADVLTRLSRISAAGE
ncbi:MAG: hypothetical protein MnENMB40S_23190 [Rhizobiaceae bacterium MnEN-MB40S]|nr:MAG: hypothetical protein MnENMB40S_23190 [Rhizobiaceae bacterium MnEN-MB40S]